jgi:hypothetical protein
MSSCRHLVMSKWRNRRAASRNVPKWDASNAPFGFILRMALVSGVGFSRLLQQRFPKREPMSTGNLGVRHLLSRCTLCGSAEAAREGKTRIRIAARREPLSLSIEWFPRQAIVLPQWVTFAVNNCNCLNLIANYHEYKKNILTFELQLARLVSKVNLRFSGAGRHKFFQFVGSEGCNGELRCRKAHGSIEGTIEAAITSPGS